MVGTKKPCMVALAVGMAAVAVCASGCSAVAPSPRPRDATRGHLLIVGGGPVPEAVMARFVELAGGPGRARILVLPMASESEDAGAELAADFVKKGVRAERVVLTRAEAEKEGTAARLEGITGVWFGGGDQSRLTAAIGGTPIEAAIARRWRDGAVVGGTSAGAAVMSAVMITGDEKRPGGSRPPTDPQSAFLTIDRGNIVTTRGFGLAGDVIVDQHFVRRRRHNRLISLVLENPRLVGIGIDESTAAEVSPDGCWTVLGESVVVVYDARRARPAPGGVALGAADLTMHVLPAGSRYRPATGDVSFPTGGR